MSIKTTIEWFSFLDIMEYTGNDMISDIPLTTSLLKVFSMFEISMTVGDVHVDAVTLMCINCKRKTHLQPKYGMEFYDKMITPFVMNSMLHHVGMSWMISSKRKWIMITSPIPRTLAGLKQVQGTTKTYVLNDMELLLKVLLNRLEQTDTISCAL